MNINEIKNTELNEMTDFINFIGDYGHIFYDDPKVLDEPFKKILEGIDEIKSIIAENYSK